MTLAVIGAGFGRTGTLSLKVALERLGFGRGYHFSEVFQNPEHVPCWNAAADGAPLDWAVPFEGYASSTGWPGCAFHDELLARYPEAKVVLGVRDPALWYESMERTVHRVMHPRPGRSQPVHELFERLVWQRTFEGRFTDRAHAIAVFEAHIAHIRASVPAERLLEHEAGTGWEPLCAFLDVPVPSRPYPHLNDRDSFAEIARRLDRG